MAADFQVTDEVRLDVKHLHLPTSRQIGWIIERTRSRCNIFLGDGYVLHDIETTDLKVIKRIDESVR